MVEVEEWQRAKGRLNLLLANFLACARVIRIKSVQLGLPSRRHEWDRLENYLAGPLRPPPSETPPPRAPPLPCGCCCCWSCDWDCCCCWGLLGWFFLLAIQSSLNREEVGIGDVLRYLRYREEMDGFKRVGQGLGYRIRN